LRVSWSFDALEQLLALNRQDARQAARVSRALRQFADSGHGDVKKLRGREGVWRLRAGDWRVMYRLDPEGDGIEIAEVRPRRDAYD
jgi:mRNA-degrading endonuclease RelE of RelBE toxin-antitoxin system